MTTVIIPDYIYNEITAKLDIACTTYPQMTDKDREELRTQIVGFVDRHGYVPDFSVERRAKQ